MEEAAGKPIRRTAPLTGAAFLCADIVQIKDESEPVPDGEQVRIIL